MRKNFSILILLVVLGFSFFNGCGGDTYTSTNDTAIPSELNEQLETLYANNAGNMPSYIPVNTVPHAPANIKLPSKVDWSEYATTVKNQGVYPTCTAFATIAVIEIQENIDNNTKKELDYSELDLFYKAKNKAPNYYKSGAVLQWLLQATTLFNGYCREIDAPYSQIPNPVTYRVKIPLCHKITGYKEFNGIDNMKYYLTKGAIVSSMLYYRDFNSYQGGVYQPKNISTFVGAHAVCLVGYDDNQKCWIIKNSWGTRWGNKGYCKVAYGVGNIERYQSYAVTTK